MTLNRKIGLFYIGARGCTASLSIFTLALLHNNLISQNKNFITSLDEFKNRQFLTANAIEQIGGIDFHNIPLYENIKTIAHRDNLNISILLENKNVKQTLNKWSETFYPAITKKNTNHTKSVDTIKKILTDFRERYKLDIVYVIYLSSAEEHSDMLEKMTLAQLRKAIKENKRFIPVNILYAFAVLDSGLPFINFTSCQANSIPALKELAWLKKVAHAGKDGKTGETYIKSVLASAFKMRNFPLLFWESHNLLGDNDGLTLQKRKLKYDKILDKQLPVKMLCNVKDQNVRIDFVKALGDWKTAWNLVEWEGIAGCRMSLQFIWRGHDGLLAAPMLWDLVKFMHLAVENNSYGVQKQLS
ncbi:MAG: inositol-3-phosphate synthase, partial [Planctomycetota bacterium]